MEYWESKTDDGLILNSGPCYHHKIRSHSAKPNIPTIHYSIIPRHIFTAQPVVSNLALRTRFSVLKEILSVSSAPLAL